MACSLNYGAMANIRICLDDVPTGGLQEIKYGLFDEVSATLEESAGKVTGTSTNSKLRTISFNKKDETTNFTEVTTNQTNGSQVIVPTLTVQLNGLNKDTRDAADKLSSPNVRLIMFVKTVDGIVWCLGRKYGMICSQVTSGTGTNSGDFNGYTLTFTGEEDDNIVPASLT